MFRLLPSLRAAIVLCSVCFMLLSALIATPLRAAELPAPLQGWQDWVLKDAPEHSCPFLYNGATRACIWPTELKLQLDDNGAEFFYKVDVFKREWVPLPGDAGHWPVAVSSGGKALPIVEQRGSPGVWLEAGQYSLKGEFSWRNLPRSIQLPRSTALLKLKLRDKPVANPNLDQNGLLWLEAPQLKRALSKAAAVQQDALSVRVFRKLIDGNPQQLATEVYLYVSGAEREVQLGPMLLPGFVPRQFDSALPARIEADGSLKVQLTPGQHRIALLAHATQPVASFSFTPSNPFWPQQEIWSFAASPQLRTLQLDGATLIDPSQTQMPQHWQELPAYLLTPDTRLSASELFRGDPNPPANELVLNKTLWLDFSGEGFTAKDEISGEMLQGWRLDIAAPYELGSVKIDDEPELVTRLADSESAGIEIRDADVNVQAVSRVKRDGSLPVSGWLTEFSRVSTELVLPPGWSVLHVSGADSARGAWLSSWSLWDIFLLLVICLSLGQLLNKAVGALAFITLLTIYQRDAAPTLVWLNLAIALAIFPYARERIARLAKVYLVASFALVALQLLPFITAEARLMVYPQMQNSAGLALFSASNSVAQERDQYAPEPAARSKVRTMRDDIGAVEEVLVSGVRAAKTESYSQPDYNPGQRIQAGPGLPSWRWQSVYINWGGPVTAAESHRIWLVSPLLNRFGHLMAVLLSLALLVSLLRKGLQLSPLPKISLKPAATVALVLPFIFAVLDAPKAQAGDIPSAELLAELRQELLKPPQCLPKCVALESVVLRADSDALSLELNIHTQEKLALPLPAQLGQWLPSRVTLNGVSQPLLHSREGRVWVLLSSGVSKLKLTGSLSGRESLTLDFGMPLHNFSAEVNGWNLSGEPSERLSSASLQLRRKPNLVNDESGQASSEPNAEAGSEGGEILEGQSGRLLPDPIAPFLRVSRSLDVGMEWRLRTVVERIAPSTGAINMTIPLVAGESPVSGNLSKTAAVASMDVRFDSNQQVVSWESTLSETEQLSLTAPTNVAWVEVWQLRTASMWHSRSEGIMASPNHGDESVPLWHPWPGESVTIHFTRPEPVAGETLAIDKASIEYRPSRRASDTSLSLSLRATQGGYYELPLPEGSKLKSVNIDGRDTPTSFVQGLLRLPLRPGEQRVLVNWQNDDGLEIFARTPSVNLGHSAANLEVEAKVSRDRWIILVGGPLLGPAVLFWSMLLLVLLLAVGLSRTTLTPLKTREWLLLSLGIATINLVVLVIVAIWFVALQWRGNWQPDTAPATKRHMVNARNLIQIGLFAISVISLMSLAASIPMSLLSVPDMYIGGNGSSASSLNWFVDQTEGQLPSGWIISLPVMAYRIAMLLWSLWLATALLRWVRWGWGQLGVQGYWFDEKEKGQA